MQLTLAPGTVEIWMLAFARIGALMLTLPALSDRAVPARMRISLAFGIVAAAVPEVAPQRGTGSIIPLFLGEILLGLSLGLCGRLVIAAMEIAGSLIAQGIGLSFAQTIDPGQGQQGELLATFFRMLGVAIIFAADLHHIMIGGIVGSYHVLPPGSMLPAGDLLQLWLSIFSLVFDAGVAIAAPFLAFGFIFNVGLGFAARLTPNIQLFFLAMPVAILIGAAGLAISLPAMQGRFLALADTVLVRLLPGH